MGNKINYIKVIKDITNTASATYGKYREYKADPVKFKTSDLNLYLTFQTAETIMKRAKYFLNSGSENKNREFGFTPNNNNPYEMLECTKSDSNEKIKANYKRLIKEYHPDTISGKDLPKGFVDFANQRFQEIHTAYEVIKKERGL